MKTDNIKSNTVRHSLGVVVKQESMYPFYMVTFYLFLEFTRIQTLVPFLSYFHLPAVTVILIAVSLFVSGKMYLKDKQTIVYISLLIEMIAHGPFAINNYWAFQVFYSMIATFIAYLGIANLVDNVYKYDKLIKYWLIAFIFISIYAYFNANLDLPKSRRYGIGVGGFIGDANDFCMAINTIIPFAVFGLFTAKTKLSKFYFILLSCLFLYVVILTESRGGFIGLVSVALYCWIRSDKKILLAIFIGLLVLFAITVAQNDYWDEIQSIKSENTEINPHGTGAQRVYAWKLGWRIFLDNPIVGVGQGNYPWNVGEAEDKEGVLWKTRSSRGRAAHSLYFTLLPELGIIGTFLYILMIVYSYKDLKYIRNLSKNRKEFISDEYWKKSYYAALALEASLIGFLVSSVFISTLYYPSFWLLCAFIISLKKSVNKYDCGQTISQP